MLADGGWVCPDGGICEKDGVKAKFELMTRVEQHDDQNASKRIKAWAREVGIDIKLAPVTEDAIYNEHLRHGHRGGQVRPRLRRLPLGLGRRQPLAGLQLRRAAHGSAWQDTVLLQPGVRQASRCSRCTPWTTTERIDLMHQAESIALRDLPYIYLVHDHTIYVTRTDTWHNWQQSPAGEAGAPLTTNWLQLTSTSRRARSPSPEPEAPPSVAPASGPRTAPPRPSRPRPRREAAAGGGHATTDGTETVAAPPSTTATTAASRPASWC